MKAKALGVFRSKLFKPCKKLLLIFKLRVKKPVFIRALPFHAYKSKCQKQKAFTTKPMSSLLSVFRSPKKSKDMDRLQDLGNPSNVHETPLFSSPRTPAYVRARMAEKSEEASRQDVEDTCRSFENYLVEMIVEEGKTRDLTDVEELLYCWKNLKCPIFIDLVCRFYGELCKDLFSPDSEEGHCSKLQPMAKNRPSP